MPSGFEDTNVDDLDFAGMSDEDLQDVKENDSRSTAQEGAQAELNRREAAADADADTDDDEPADADEEHKALVEDKQRRLLVNPENADGFNNDPDVGQNEVQAKFDEMEISGINPPTGGPPDPSHTVAGVTNTLEDDAGTREKAEEDFETLHGRAPGDPVV